MRRRSDLLGCAAAVLTLWVSSCSGTEDAPAGDDASRAPGPDVGVECVPGEPLAPGPYRLYLQGAGGEQDDDGRFPLLLDRRDVLDGDHFIMNAGSFVEFVMPLASPLASGVRLRVPRDDVPGVVAEYAVLLLREDREIELLRVEDGAPGNQGRTPFDRAFEIGEVRPECGDRLLVRLSNRTGGTLGIVIVVPDYLAYLDVEVPE